jgi:SNF2 family DNA or RNA helicase
MLSTLTSILCRVDLVEIRRVEFPSDSEHKATYDALYETARCYFIDSLESEGREALGKYMEILSTLNCRIIRETSFRHYLSHNLSAGLILRIRQACNHLSLIPSDYRQRASELRKAIVTLGKEEGTTLLNHLKGVFANADELVECAVCMNELEEKDAVILRKCQHIFCEACLEQIENQMCPLCRAVYSPDDMVKKEAAEAASKKVKVDADEAIQRHDRSPKMQALLDSFEEMKSDEKGVIFSQWTSMLDIVAAEFDELGIVYTRIDGTMNANARADAMRAFDKESTAEMEAPRFILCSLSKFDESFESLVVCHYFASLTTVPHLT